MGGNKKWWKTSGTSIWCAACGFYNFKNKTTCAKCDAALPPEDTSGKVRRPRGRWAYGPPDLWGNGGSTNNNQEQNLEYALKIVAEAVGKEAADQVREEKQHKEPAPEKEKVHIGKMLEAAEAVRQAYGDGQAALLEKVIEDARKKKLEAKPPHVRVMEAESKSAAAEKAHTKAAAAVAEKQKELAEVMAVLTAAEEKRVTTQQELAKVKATAYVDKPNNEEAKSARAQAAQEGLEHLQGLDLPPQAKAAVEAMAACMPKQEEAAAQDRYQDGSNLQVPAEDIEMPDFDDLPTERAQQLIRKWGEGEEAQNSAKEAWQTMRKMANESMAAKKQRK